ncbi:MAG TPA: S16 family serine protease [Candidatus Baltobacteraceae bacterium]
MWRRFVALVALGIALGALATVPTSYWFLAPGNAVDLSTRVHVDGFAAAPDQFYLTDVTVAPAPPLVLAFGRFVPGVRLVRQDLLIPTGVAPKAYDRVLDEAMVESQDIAAVVAERAAGFRVVQPPTQVYVADILAQSKARKLLRIGDQILSIAGHPIAGSADVTAVISKLAASNVDVVERRGRTVLRLHVPTIAMSGGRRLGIRVETRTQQAQLPVPVRFDLNNISGSSGGLMLALHIYDTLRHEHYKAATRIAGTGTLSYDGTVGPIEGTMQKLIAAQRAGITLFLVPNENYADVSSVHGVRIIPVGSFREALAALRS